MVFVALLLAILLAALDQTIVSTILRVVVADLGHQELISWIGSAYLITATSFSLLYGRMSDIFGRKWVFIFAIAVFEIGSAICGAANSMELLIVGRAIAGVGGGGIFSLVLIIITDIVSIADRGKYQGMIGAVFGLSSVIGPLIGGGFADNGLWRWCFYINLPVGVITMAFVIFVLNLEAPTGSVADKIRQIDFLGTCIVFIGVTCFVTPIQLAGSTWEWSSPQTIALLVVSVLLLLAFMYVQTKVAKNPIVPPSILMNSSVPAFLVIAFSLGAAFFSAVYYIALFFQVDYGVSATAAGLNTIPLIFGVVLLSISSGQIVSRTGKYVHFLYIGGVLVSAGLIATSFLTPSSSLAARVCFLLILGVGCGSLIQIRIIGLQASVDLPKIAVVTAVSQFMQTLGGAFGIAITGTMLNNVLSAQIDSHPTLIRVLESSPALSAIPRTQVVVLREALVAAAASGAVPNAAEALVELLDSFTMAYANIFRLLLLFSGAILVAAPFVKPAQIRGAHGGGARKK
ncbi:major facilitator superfamily domain-containing protein [Zopfochytrium polystomum]|nr:major facilitator superfamily domain-containing protein [Zopfochytrium polystomum]